MDFANHWRTLKYVCHLPLLATRRTLSSSVKRTWISQQTTCMQENLRGIKVRSSSDRQLTKRSGRPLKTSAIASGFAFTTILIFPLRELAWTADVMNERDNILSITMHCGKAVVPPLIRFKPATFLPKESQTFIVCSCHESLLSIVRPGHLQRARWRPACPVKTVDWPLPVWLMSMPSPWQKRLPLP